MMKLTIARLWLLAGMLAGFLGGGPAEAGTTAGAALEVFAGEKGAEARQSVVGVRGERGQDQPERWEVVVADAVRGGHAVYLVDGTRVLEGGRVKGKVEGAPVSWTGFRIDSDAAFRIADVEARKARVGFDSIDYALRGFPGEGAPRWQLRLRDAAGRETGAVEIHGTTGSVMGGKWGGKAAEHGGSPVASALPRRSGGEIEIEESSEAMRGESEALALSPTARERARKPTPEEHRRALGSLWNRSTAGIESAGTSARTGFKQIGMTFADIVKGRAAYGPSGKRGWSPNRGAASRGN